MFVNSGLGAALETMLRGIDTPPVPLSAILQKAREPERLRRNGLRFFVPAAAAAAAVLALTVAVPAAPQSAVHALEARLAAMLGWTPPPAPPIAVKQALRPESATLATAQTRVSFKLVPPAGLPSDVTSTTITTSPTGEYSKPAHSWQVGSREVTFTYQRASGRSFFLIADRFDPQTGPPSRYIYDADGVGPDGRPMVVKHERFAWRNGAQVMTVVEDEGITPPEIAAIRVAMDGVAMPLTQTRKALDAGSKIKMYHIGAP